MTTIYDDYVESIKFITPFRCFIQGDKISFRPGLNVLVGENGTGKSSIVELVRKSVIYSEFAIVKIPSGWAVGGFDFERGNPRVQTATFVENLDINFQIESQKLSHGETNRKLIRAMLSQVKNCTLCLDEPDQSLSIKGCWELCQTLEKLVSENNVQVIAACHNPIIIMYAKEVYSCEHRSWMSSKEYIRRQRRVP